MRSVADDARREQRERMQAMTPVERMALIDDIAARDLEFFMAGQKVSRTEALRRIRETRRRGRRRSRCMDE
jgi:hypothetical protein